MSDFDATVSAPPLATPSGGGPAAALAQEAARKRKEAEALAGRADAGAAELAKARGTHVEQVKADRAADEQKYQAATGDIQKTLGERPHTDMPNPDLGPPVDPKKTSDLMWAVMGLSLIGIAGSKKHYGNATAAMDGMLKGFKEGSEEQVKLHKDKFEREFREAQTKQREATSVYEDLLKSKELSLNQVAHLIQVNASANQDWEMEQAARARDFEKMFARVDRLNQGADRLDQTVAQMTDRMQARADARKAREDAKAKAAGGFAGANGELMAALAERGVSLPAGFRSKDQQVAMLDGLRKRNPGLTADQIADKVESGQIELNAARAESRTAGGIAGKVAYAEKEIEQIAPLVREASANVPRGKFVPWNKLKQYTDAQLSDPNLKELHSYLNTLSNAYDMLAARGGTDKDKRAENRKLFDTADSPQALERAITAIEKEAKASGIAGRASMKSHIGEQPAPPPNTNSKGWTLHTDKDGNQAYVSPDGKQYEEVK